MTGGHDLASAMAGVWARHRDTMTARIDAVERAAADLRRGALDPGARRDAEREAHKLAGSVGTFGFAEGSRLARAAEELLGGDAPLGEPEGARLAEIVASLRLELARPLPGTPSPAPPPVSSPREEAHAPGAPHLLIVDPDAESAARIAAEAAARGMRAVIVAGCAAARAAVGERRPDAVVLDPGIEGGEGWVLLRSLGAITPPISTVVLTASQGFHDRVEAARAGALGFVTRPAPAARILDAVRLTLHDRTDREYTVLAVDDDVAVLRALTALLEPRGIRVESITDPLDFWDAIDVTGPDVVVLDVDMPGVNGLELCRVLRGDPHWRAIPILFLTARTDADSITAMFAAGADDYVPKPMVGPELVARIVNRLERVHLLRHLADTDPLTGVANRRRAIEQMEQLLRLADRQAKPFSLALVDLDHFKRVNDGWGHAVGDEVLRRVARMLGRHFRAEDVVARWGGEEFAVGLFGMEREDGVQRLRAFQERLREERFGDPPLAVTLSAGIAQAPADGDDVDALYRAADAALYRAKAAGRDRVEAAVGERGAAPAPERVDVLVVHRDDAFARTLLAALTSHGYRGRRAADGGEVAALLGGERPALLAGVVVIGMDAEDATGFDVLAETGILERTHAIVLTGPADASRAAGALAKGAFDHLADPFTTEGLLRRIRRAMRA